MTLVRITQAQSAPQDSAPQPTQTTVDETTARAREHFLRGVELFNQGDNEGALAEFRNANELVYHPKVWFNIGMVLADMSQPVEAVDAFDRALAGGASLEPELAAAAKKRRESLLDSIGTLEIACATSGASVIIDGVERGKTPLHHAVALPSGRHVVELLKDEYKLLRREPVLVGRGHFVLEVVLEPHSASLPHSPPAIAASPAPSLDHEPPTTKLELEPETTKSQPQAWRYPVAYSSLALGGAGLLLAGVSVVAGRSLCPDAGCPPNPSDTNADRYESWRTTAMAATVGAALFAGAGLLLVLTAPDDATAVAFSVGPRMLRATIGF